MGEEEALISHPVTKRNTTLCLQCMRLVEVYDHRVSEYKKWYSENTHNDSIKKLREKTGMSFTSLSLSAKGERKISLENLDKIWDFLKKSRK